MKIAPNLSIIETGSTDEVRIHIPFPSIQRILNHALDHLLLSFLLVPLQAHLALLKSFKHLHTIDIPRSRGWRDPNPTLDPKDPELRATIKTCRAILKASPSTERKYLRLCWRTEKGADEGERKFVQIGLE